VVLSPGVIEESWSFTLPPGWCPRATDPAEAANEIGSFRQTVGGGEAALSVERRLELRRRWVEVDEVEALSELSLTELRARKRRLRLERCTGQ
jgi:hypothetical protein